MIRKCGIADGFTSSSQRIALSPDGTLLANFSEYEVQVRVWDLTSGRQIYTIGANLPEEAAEKLAARGGRGGENLLTFYEAGKVLLLIGGNGARRFDARTGKELRKYDWAASPLAVSPNGRWCLTNENQENTTGPRKFAVVDLTTGKVGPAFESGAGRVQGNVAVSADGKRFAVIEADVKVTAYDATTGKEIASFDAPAPEGRDRGYTMPAFSEDGKLLYVGTAGGKIQRYDLATKAELPVLGSHLWYVTGVTRCQTARP